DELGSDRVLIHRHGNTAEALRRELRPIKPRAVVADYRELVAAPEAERGETQRKVAHLPVIPGPAVGLPKASVLLAPRRPLGHRLRVMAKHARQGRPIGHSAASLRSAAVPR